MESSTNSVRLVAPDLLMCALANKQPTAAAAENSKRKIAHLPRELRGSMADVRRSIDRYMAQFGVAPVEPVDTPPRASAREHGGRRVTAGARSPDDPDPDPEAAKLARERARKRDNKRASRDRQRQTCRCGYVVLRLHDGLCRDCYRAATRQDAQAAADRATDADYKARLAEPVEDVRALLGRVQAEAQDRQAAWCGLPSANGNREELRATTHEATGKLDDLYERLRIARAHDRRAAAGGRS
jgi:hypothetical protein